MGVQGKPFSSPAVPLGGGAGRGVLAVQRESALKLGGVSDSRAARCSRLNRDPALWETIGDHDVCWFCVPGGLGKWQVQGEEYYSSPGVKGGFS